MSSEVQSQTSLRKAVITAAGRGTRQYPASNTVQKELFPLIDSTGYAKPTLQIIVEECLESGIEEICIVANPSNLSAIQAHFVGPTQEQRESMASKPWALKLGDDLDEMAQRISYVIQEEQEGFGHAVYQAREWVGDEPFLLMLGDHVYLSPKKRCARQMVEAYGRYKAPIASLVKIKDDEVPRVGVVMAHLLEDGDYKITNMLEKPSMEEARAHFRIDGLAPDEYITFFGIHAFPAAIFDCLGYAIEHNMRRKNEIQLTTGMELLLHRSPLYAGVFIEGARFDMGVPEGFIETQVALAMASPYKDYVQVGIDAVKRIGII